MNEKYLMAKYPMWQVKLLEQDSLTLTTSDPVVSVLQPIKREESGQSANFSLNKMVSIFWLILPKIVHLGRVKAFTGRPPWSSAEIAKHFSSLQKIEIYQITIT